MLSRRSLLVAIASGAATIGLSGLSSVAANAAKTYTVCKTSAVPVKGGKTFSVGDKKILITQPKKGTFKAFAAVCTHAGAILGVSEGSVKDNVITCTSHGASFDADSGKTKSTIASALNKVTVSVSGGNVKVKF
jgi:nitrite reductase/ring-hydroxylating ferredoxin subunit